MTAFKNRDAEIPLRLEITGTEDFTHIWWPAFYDLSISMVCSGQPGLRSSEPMLAVIQGSWESFIQ